MDSGSGLRVEVLNGQGHSQAQGHAVPAALSDQRRRRAHWLIDLVQALQDGNLEAARVQFAGLVQADPGLGQHPLLHRIGQALHSGQLKTARQWGDALRDESLAVWNDLAHVHSPVQNPPAQARSPSSTDQDVPTPMRVHRASNGQHIVDCRA